MPTSKPSLNAPRSLIDCSISELLAVTQGIDPWTETLARQLDHALRGRVVDALTQRVDDDELAELQRAIKTAIPHRVRPSLKALEQDWLARWLSWAELLDTRRAQLQSRDPDRVRHLLHVPEILHALAHHPGSTQTELAKQTQLSAPNLSRLLRILEDHDLIERRREGQSKRVYLRKSALSLASPLSDALQNRGHVIEPRSARLLSRAS